MIIEPPIPELEFLFFYGVVLSGVKLNEEMLQIRAELGRIEKRQLLLSVLMTSNIELLGRGFITLRMAKSKRLMAIHPSLP